MNQYAWYQITSLLQYIPNTAIDILKKCYEMRVIFAEFVSKKQIFGILAQNVVLLHKDALSTAFHNRDLIGWS